jgi:uncharacterized protein (DUF1501 family)
MSANQASRRQFLRQTSALSLLGSAAPLALQLAAAGSAAAQSASDYRALVCVFLFGGNDSFNTVLATDAASWGHYSRLRNQSPESIALLAAGTPALASAALSSPARLGGVLPISPTNPQGRSYALHPMLGSLQRLFNSERRLAVLANVGPLVQPTSKAQYALATHARPPKLFSHNDQQSVWQSMGVEGSTRGWGGRVADALLSMNGAAGFTAISAYGSAVWLSGQNVRAYQVSANGPVRAGFDTSGAVYGSQRVGEALRRVIGTSFTGHVLESDYAAVVQRSMQAELELRGLLPAQNDGRWATVAASYDPARDPRLTLAMPSNGLSMVNPLAHQLQMVARLIQAGRSGALAVKRQVFFVGLGGFDTHNTQNSTHTDLMARLAHGLNYFDEVLGSLGARSQVTTFTASDFGRTFTSNGNGTDHGWGGHHLVMGGAVRGGDLYGRFPTLGAKNAGNNGFDSSTDQLHNGVLLPSSSVDQYGATLARWFGLSDTQLLDAFPNLANFSNRNLGFMLA